MVLSGCNTAVPVKAKFPEVPVVLLEEPMQLIKLPADKRDLSDMIDNANTNYGTYYEVRAKLISWQSWYKQQKEIFDKTYK